MSDLGSIYSRLMHRFVLDVREAFHQFVIWLGRLSDGERLILFCAFILLLLTFFIHRDSNGKRRRIPIWRQFGGSILIIMIVGFGAGWFFDSRHEYGFLKMFG